MTRLDKLVVAMVLLLLAVLVAGRQSAFHGSEIGRRPILQPAPAPPFAAQPNAAPSLPERVRRPPLLDPNVRDPVVPVLSDNPHSGSLLLGTAFSVDPRGVWMTARHAAGTPALPLSSDGLTIEQAGFSFGYPTGILGATRDELMGRSRMLLGGRLAGFTPTLTWVETRRFPDTLETLSGMSGGPMLDDQGRVIGIVVAATARRGRIHTVAPELLRQVQRDTTLFSASPRQAPTQGIADRPGSLTDVATALSEKSRIARVYCKVD
jgi:hypothetical protein